MPKIHIVRTSDGADFPLPGYASKHHVGLNLRAAIAGPIKINPRERVRVPVGFAFAIPDGLCGQVVSFSKLAREHGIVVIDAPSLINPADHEPLFVLLRNESTEQFILRRGDIIAQLLMVPVVQVAWDEVSAPNPSDVSNADEMMMDEEMSFDENNTSKKEHSKRAIVSIRNRGTKS